MFVVYTQRKIFQKKKKIKGLNKNGKFCDFFDEKYKNTYIHQKCCEIWIELVNNSKKLTKFVDIR